MSYGGKVKKIVKKAVHHSVVGARRVVGKNKRLKGVILNNIAPHLRVHNKSNYERWLETNFPDYKQVVAEELEKLKKEISQAAPQILAAAQQPNHNDSLTKESPQSIDLAQEHLRQSIDANPDNKYAGLQDTEQSAGFNPGQPITPQQEGPAQAWPTEQPPAGPGI